MSTNDNKDVLEAVQLIAAQVTDVSEQIQELATHVDKRFEQVENKINEVRDDLSAKIAQVDEKVVRVNEKVDFIAVKLVAKEIITPDDAREIMHFDPKLPNTGHASA